MSDPYDPGLFLGYLEGDLNPQQTAQFEQAMHQDGRLRNLVAQLMVDRQALRQMPHAEVPADLMDQVSQQLERETLLGHVSTGRLPAPAAGVHWGRWMAYGSLAALVIISMSIVLVIFRDSLNVLQSDDLDRSALDDVASAPDASAGLASLPSGRTRPIKDSHDGSDRSRGTTVVGDLDTEPVQMARADMRHVTGNPPVQGSERKALSEPVEVTVGTRKAEEGEIEPAPEPATDEPAVTAPAEPSVEPMPDYRMGMVEPEQAVSLAMPEEAAGPDGLTTNLIEPVKKATLVGNRGMVDLQDATLSLTTSPERGVIANIASNVEVTPGPAAAEPADTLEIEIQTPDADAVGRQLSSWARHQQLHVRRIDPPQPVEPPGRPDTPPPPMTTVITNPPSSPSPTDTAASTPAAAPPEPAADATTFTASQPESSIPHRDESEAGPAADDRDVEHVYVVQSRWDQVRLLIAQLNTVHHQTARIVERGPDPIPVIPRLESQATPIDRPVLPMATAMDDANRAPREERARPEPNLTSTRDAEREAALETPVQPVKASVRPSKTAPHRTIIDGTALDPAVYGLPTDPSTLIAVRLVVRQQSP